MTLHPYCNKCGWRKGGIDSWDGKACKCGHREPPMQPLEECSPSRPENLSIGSAMSDGAEPAAKAERRAK